MTRTRERAPWVGLVVAFVLATVAMLLPAVTGWDVHVRYFPPLHATWDPRVGPGSLPALVLGILAVLWAIPLAERLRWWQLLVAAYVVGVGWLFALAFVDGSDGIGKVLDDPYEYMNRARSVTDLGAELPTWVERIPYDGQPGGNWPVHVAGHPPGALHFFIVLVRLGQDTGYRAGVVVTLVAATTALAVMCTLRALGREDVARRAAPFLVFAPAAVWQAVSADAVFAAVAAWGIALLAFSATRRRLLWSVLWSLAAGLVLGYAVMLSYGLPLLGLLALAVLVVSRSWWPLPGAVIGALVVVGAYWVNGFDYLDALSALHTRYWEGVASNRPPAYWVWGDFAALAFSAGPLAFAGLANLVRPAEAPRREDLRVVRWLSGAVFAVLLVADLSQMSKAEVERIWLPFVPWLLVSCALLPPRWRRWGILLQVVLALAVQHLLDTGW